MVFVRWKVLTWFQKATFWWSTFLRDRQVKQYLSRWQPVTWSEVPCEATNVKKKCVLVDTERRMTYVGWLHKVFYGRPAVNLPNCHLAAEEAACWWPRSAAHQHPRWQEQKQQFIAMVQQTKFSRLNLNFNPKDLFLFHVPAIWGPMWRRHLGLKFWTIYNVFWPLRPN